MRSILLGAALTFSMLQAADSAAGISWTAPSSWKAQPDRPMRAATYSVPPAAGDKDPGEFAVFYFGQGQGGDVQSNVTRWIGQFEQPETKTPQKRTIAGMQVTTIDVSGAYTAGGGPMAAAKGRQPGYRLLGAIVTAPEGNVFFKFTGPAKTVAANEAAFEALLKSLKK